MKKITITLTLFLLFSFFSETVYSQNQENFDKSQSNPNVCNQKSFENTEKLYNKRKLNGSELLGRLERNLKELVSDCAYTSWHNQAEEYLKTIEEEQSEKHFFIAQQYWKKFKEGKIKSATGAIARLKLIIEDYPNYSKIDKVEQLYNEAKEVISGDEMPN